MPRNCPLKILVLHSELGVLRGGGENFTKNLFSEFVRRGHRVSAAFVADNYGRYPFSLPGLIETIPIKGWWKRDLGQKFLTSFSHRLGNYDAIQPLWNRVREAISWRTFRWHNRRFMHRIQSHFAAQWHNYDVVYVHGDTVLASTAAFHRPTVLRLPGPVTSELEPLLRSIHSVCANGDALVRVREFLGDHAQELPIGVDVQRFKPGFSAVKSLLNWRPEHRVIGFVGRLAHIKGLDLLTAGYAQAIKRDANLRLLIIGEGEETANIHKVLAREIAQGLVHIEPDLDHDVLPDWYRAMDLLVMPSRYENFSNAIIEAMACGVPFLAAGVGGNIGLAKQEVGWLFSPGSVASLVDTLEKIIKDESARQLRGRNGVRYVEGCCSWEASAMRLENIFSTVLAQ